MFAALFSLSPQVAHSRAAGAKMVRANLIGAMAAVIFYYLILAVPEYHYFVLLVFLATLFFGVAVFNGNALANPACIALLVLIGTSNERAYRVHRQAGHSGDLDWIGGIVRGCRLGAA